jgi:hypothetical protein
MDLMATTVVNIKKKFLNQRGIKDFEEWASNPNHIYIGRNMSFYIKGAYHSKWANPYTVKSNGREKCLELYEKYICESDLINDLDELDGCEIGCYCKPGACHGDILIKLLMKKKVMEQGLGAEIAYININGIQRLLGTIIKIKSDYFIYQIDNTKYRVWYSHIKEII